MSFQYEAVDGAGKKVAGVLDAANKQEAKQKLQGQGLFPTALREAVAAPGEAAAAVAGPKRGVGFRVSQKELTAFTTQLSTLMDAGLPIVRSLRILEGQLRRGLLKTTIGTVAEEVEGGSPLSEAMSKHPRVFDRLYTNMVKAGEVGGVLDKILARLAEFMERSFRLRKKIRGAMMYPSAVILFAVAVVTLLIVYIVPRFEALFVEMKMTLPPPTQVLIGFSRWVMRNIVWIPLVFVALIGGLVAATRHPKVRYLMDAMRLKLPVFGPVVRKAAVARWARTLGTLTASGVGILEALEICRGTAHNEVLSRAIDSVKDSVREGESISGPLSQWKVFDDVVVHMVDVGEETGALDKMLLKIADTYDSDVEIAVGGLVSLLEPLLIIFVGGVVFFIVLSLFLPLVTLIQKLGAE